MGASHSAAEKVPKSSQEVYAHLTSRIAPQFDALDLQTIRKTFEQLATPVGDLSIWTEDTFVKFLEVPGRVGSLLFLSATYVAAYPLRENSPKVLEYDALLRCIAIFTGRTNGLLSDNNRLQLLFESFAVVSGTSATEPKHNSEVSTTVASTPQSGQMKPDQIRKEDLVDLIQFCLAIQEKRDVEVVSQYIDHLQGEQVLQFQEAARAIADSISSTESVSAGEVTQFLKTSPHLFSSLSSLYAHFLYPGAKRSEVISKSKQSLSSENILNGSTSAQLGLFLPRELIRGKLDALYTASHDGFSMSSFESKVLRYPGPSVLLIDGTDVLSKETIQYGFYNSSPWKNSSKETFGDSSTTLFELRPRHSVYTGETLKHKIWFAKSLGIGIGCMPPAPHTKIHDFGNLSLVLDTSLEFADFRSTSGTTKCQIREVEVWGLGGDREAQRKAWEWEENEAQRRRTINVKDMQADYGMSSGTKRECC